ncbi:MAGUK p55 subfamily member 5-like isoform X2 [Ctenocephalides felis]|nr:MAGUK p55 subfamily member 5-like isoform X2 [Ctenocephalides felis]
MVAVMSLAHDNGPHREMAVDVPDSFVARNKTPPRYPPPKPPSSGTVANQVPSATPHNHQKPHDKSDHRSQKHAHQKVGQQTHIKSNNRNSSYDDQHVGHKTSNGTPSSVVVENHKMNGSVVVAPPSAPLAPSAVQVPIPPPREHLRIEKDGRLVNRAPAPQVPARGTTTIAAAPTSGAVQPTVEQLESMRKYQDQLRRRREQQQQQEQEQQLLRASLRGSAKLRALQQQTPQQVAAQKQQALKGTLNEAYEPHEDEILDDSDKEVGDEDVKAPGITTYAELTAALSRLQQALRAHSALSARCARATQALQSQRVARALRTRREICARRLVDRATSDDAQGLARECTDMLRELTASVPLAPSGPLGASAGSVSISTAAAARELCDLLGTYEMEGLLQAHDGVIKAIPKSAISHSPKPVTRPHLSASAASSIGQVGPTTAPALLAEDDGVRIIQIEKTNEPLGATIRNEGESVVVGRVVRGGAAEKTGLLREGDELLEVNGLPLRGKSVNDVCAALAGMTGTLTLLVAPRSRLTPPVATAAATAPSVLHVRAHFDYDPEEDLYIPCRELGIGFRKGDVLHVIGREDPNWWQAFREGEEDQTLAGLIPSQAFQHQRESMRQSLALAAAAAASGDSTKAGSRRVAGTLLCSRAKQPKRRKRGMVSGSGAGLGVGGGSLGKGSGGSESGYPLYSSNSGDEPEPIDQILTYEEVALHYPRADRRRPVVLIGPPNIGRHELRQRLMADPAGRFAAAVPHTSRPRSEGEVAGQDYHFISRAQFEADILARRFVEHGEYEKAYYGTSLDAIRSVVASGKICVLNLHPQSLRLLRASDLKPYTVLVAPPSLEKLRQKRLRTGEPYKEEELKDIIATAREMEARWGHLFDMIIINNDTERAYQQLLAEINSLEREPQWVPAAWLH